MARKLTEAQRAVLASVTRHEDDWAACGDEQVARDALIPAAAVERVVRALIKRGLVRVTTCADYAPTAEGRAALAGVQS
jgi:DNA-binding MarR family transcriptional regulator